MTVRRIAGPILALATVLSGTVMISARPVGADSLSSDQAQAAQIESELTQDQVRIGALGQQYDAAQYHLQQINAQISTTKAALASAQAKVVKDKANLRSAAIDAYVSAGTVQTTNPLFSSNQKTYIATTEYGSVASNELASNVSNLTVAQDYLGTIQSHLQVQQTAAQAADQQASSALSQAQNLQASAQSQLSSLKGQIASLVKQQQEAQAAAQAAAQRAAATPPGSINTGGGGGAGQNIPNPPSNLSAGARAVQYAESQVGVPYVWGAAAPGQGFDCSGLVMWAWGEAGVSLPHYSGAQMADTTPVPLADIEPGDLIFFGPGGDTHVAMYVGGGEIIQAPYTGADVGYASLASMISWGGSDFAGVGRPY
jgi:cell wall-associated NlpC family hydrolase